MANTFKLVSKANVTSADVIYTVAGSTTTVVLGIMIGNTTTGQITATVSLASDTSSRSGANNEANQTVELVTNAPIPCLLYTSPSPRDGLLSRMPSSA